ncbi:MAG: helix-turn-helix domain-containing protein, partial [Methyloceanibacter sp.]|uniref:helix-turn-helix domain-containing protein n=1 Tax=Methyloceanibacter sp. TaxID=1965321 RepID=UPI003C43AA15
GVNMLEAINIRRLEKAHALLERAGPDQTVTSIATHLGFFELGRFAVRYRKRFGEKPSETLGRRAKKY